MRNLSDASFVYGFGVYALLLSAAAHPVELRFGWQPGMSCEVLHRVMQPADENSAPRVSLRYTLKTERAEEGGLLVRAVNPRPDPEVSGGSKQERELVAALFVAGSMPPFRVSASGELIGLEDLERARKSMREVYELTLAPTADPAAFERAMAVMGSREMLENMVGVFWNPTVASWAGLEIGLQQPLQTDYVVDLPLGVSARIRMTGTVELAQLAPCQRGRTSQTCAMVKVTERADPADAKRVVEALASQYGGSPERAPSSSETLDVRTVIQATLEPQTLIPHLVSAEKHVSTTNVEDGKPVSQSQSERREWAFECQTASREAARS
jgi:hypothetical protein